MQKALCMATFVLALGYSAWASAQVPLASSSNSKTLEAKEAIPVPGYAPTDSGSLQSSDSDFAAPQQEGLMGAFIRMVLVLGLVLALAYLILNFGLRRLMKSGQHPQASLKIHARLALEPKKNIFLVEAGESFLLLGAGEREVRLIAKLDSEKTRAALATSAKPSTTSPRKSFWERLSVKPPSPKQNPTSSSGTQSE